MLLLVLVSRTHEDAGIGTRTGNETMFPSVCASCSVLKFKVGMERSIVGGGCFFKAVKMATIGVPLGSPSSTSSGSSPLTLDRG